MNSNGHSIDSQERPVMSCGNEPNTDHTNEHHLISSVLTNEEILLLTNAGRELLTFLRGSNFIAFQICFESGIVDLVHPSSGVGLDMAYNLRFSGEVAVPVWWHGEVPNDLVRSHTHGRINSLITHLKMEQTRPFVILWMIAGDTHAHIDFNHFEYFDDALAFFGRSQISTVDSCLVQPR